jgi:hypothetical protein
MISIKCKITNKIDIDDYARQFNNVVRYAYNRFTEGKSLSEIYHLSNKLNNIDLLDASFVESAVIRTKGIYDSQIELKIDKIIFGSKHNFWKVKYKKESKEILEKNKWVWSQGRADFKGNRKFNFDLDNHRVVFKPKKGIKIEILFNKLSKNQEKLLKQAQLLSQNKQTPITVTFSRDEIIFTFDEKILVENDYTKPIIKNRILSMDSNPQYIGLVITDYIDDEPIIVHKEVIDLTGLKEKSTNKRNHEIFSVAQRIAKLAKHYQCEMVGYEKLNIKPSDRKKGRNFNRLTNNLWNRTRFFSNLNKWLNIFNIKYQEIQCEYSSFIGQMTNPEEPDMIAAAIEIGRRTYLFNRIFIRKDKEKCNIIYPDINSMISPLPTRWKEMVKEKSWNTWIPLYKHLKETKSSYRVPFSSWSKLPERVHFSHMSSKSNVLLCV